MKTILLKVSGEVLNHDAILAGSIARQLAQLTQTHTIGVVVGGGNFFRGAKEGKEWGLAATTGDAVGMLATVMNGLILQDLFGKAGIACTLLSALPIAGVVQPISQEAIINAHAQKKVIIFVGGTGSPYFSTDTTAIVRALQMGAQEIWKATKVGFIYDSDPAINQGAKPLTTVTYDHVLKNNLRIMDQTAFALAQEHKLTIRVFNIFEKDALIKVADNPNVGSTLRS